jgi:hypothetical protein
MATAIAVELWGTAGAVDAINGDVTGGLVDTWAAQVKVARAATDAAEMRVASQTAELGALIYSAAACVREATR